MFSYESCEIFKNTYFEEHFGMVASIYSLQFNCNDGQPPETCMLKQTKNTMTMHGFCEN